MCDAGPTGPYLLEDCSEEFTALTYQSADGAYGVNGTLQSADYDYFMAWEGAWGSAHGISPHRLCIGVFDASGARGTSPSLVCLKCLTC